MNTDRYSYIEEALGAYETASSGKFKWLMGVSALPFLLGGREYWAEAADKSRKLLGVLRALDSALLLRNIAARQAAETIIHNISGFGDVKSSLQTAAGLKSAASSSSVSSLRLSMEDRISVAVKQYETAQTGDTKDKETAGQAEKGGKTEADKSSRMRGLKLGAAFADASIAATVCGSVSETLFYAEKAAYFFGMDFSETITKCYDAFRQTGGEIKTVPISPEMYRNVWKNAMSTLKTIGGAYWENWYEQLLRNRFEYTENEVWHRFTVPDKVRRKGAIGVGKYMSGYHKK